MKMNALILLAGMIFISSGSFAYQNSSNDLVSACETVALNKLQQIAHLRNAILLPETLHVDGIDNRFLNPYKYVWFSAQAQLNNGDLVQLKTLTQKSSFRACF